MKIIIAIIVLILITVACYAVAPSLDSFNIGQVGPDMEARVDFPKYSSACRTMENFLPLTQGPVMRRTGTKYISDTNDATVVRIISFEYSTDDSYILELSDSCMRFFRTDANNDGGSIEE